MIIDAGIEALLLARLMIKIVPGPTMAMVILTTATYDSRAGLGTATGAALAEITLILSALILCSTIADLFPVVGPVLRWFAVGFLVYFAIRTWLGGGCVLYQGDTPTLRRHLACGFMAGVSNPKALLFYVCILPELAPLELGLSMAAIQTVLPLLIVTTTADVTCILATSLFARRNRTVLGGSFAARISSVLLLLAALFVSPLGETITGTTIDPPTVGSTALAAE